MAMKHIWNMLLNSLIKTLDLYLLNQIVQNQCKFMKSIEW